ncbi:hypothetical protein SDC9_77240 [bioreactor metagenome]|uniref:DUF5317 domain-containing protein n=1 Tax=bioreactor metagenome TaxID=1076179 RepID=A0A644YQE5_9ZZZZ
MLIFSALCAVAAGLCLGGRLSRIERAGISWLPLPVAALIFRLIALSLNFNYAGNVALVFSYGFLFLFLVKNRHLHLPMLAIGLGSILNFTVIAANGFHMPVSAQAATALTAQGYHSLLAGEIPMYTLAGETTRLGFLGDIIWFPIPLFRGFASAGDILMTAGVIVLILRVMAPTRPAKLFAGRKRADAPNSPEA